MTSNHGFGADPAADGARLSRALTSGNAEHVARALAELRELPSPRVPLPPPPPEILDAFPDGAPWEVVRDYIWVLAHHRPFEPALTPQQMVRWWTETVVRNADSTAALQVVLYLRGGGLGQGADVADLISYLATRRIQPGREAQGAEHLARYLLDHSQTYDRAVRALAAWKGLPVLDDVLRAVIPYVHPEDRADLGLDQGEAR